MRLFKNTFLVAVFGLALVSLTGCDAAEQSARDLASKAEQAAQELAQEKLKESVNALNEQLDKAQEKTETWMGKPAPETGQSGQKQEPDAKPLPSKTVET